MIVYTKIAACTTCSFSETSQCEVWGDFDGWSDVDLQINPEKCRWCLHAKKLGVSPVKTKEKKKDEYRASSRY